MQQLLPTPNPCPGRCPNACVVVVNSSSGDVNPDLWGEEDPNTAGLTPANTALWGTYHQLIPGTTIEMTRWNWNPDADPLQWQ